MSAERKFLFDRSFDPPEEEAEDENDVQEEEEEIELAPTYSEQELAIAREESFNAGKEEGVREASDAIEAQTLDTMRALGIQVPELFRHMERHHSETFHEAISAAVTIVRKFFPNMTEEHNITEIEKMLGTSRSELLEEPRVIMHVHPSIAARLTERIDAIAADAHFEGRVVIMEHEETAPGNCRVEWSNGGAERNLQDLWRQIDDVVRGNLSASDVQADGEPEERQAGDDMETAAVENVPPVAEETPEPNGLGESVPESPAEDVVDQQPAAVGGAPAEPVAEPAVDDTATAAAMPEAPPAPSQAVDESAENHLESTLEDEATSDERAPPVPSETEAEDDAGAGADADTDISEPQPEADGMAADDDNAILESDDKTD